MRVFCCKSFMPYVWNVFWGTNFCLVIGALLVFGCSVYAMEERRGDFLKDVTQKFELGDDDSIVDLSFVNSRTLFFLARVYSNEDFVLQFGQVDTDDDSARPVIHQKFPGIFSVAKITSAGNLLLSRDNDRLELYVSRTGQRKVFSSGARSKIVALLDNVVIEGHDNKSCKAIASVTADGDLHCMEHDERNSQRISLINLAGVGGLTNCEIVTADMQVYTASFGMLPFVAFLLRSRDLYSEFGWYANKALVYNPLSNETIALNGHGAFIQDIRFLPDKTVCAASNDGTFSLFDPLKKEKLYTVQCFDTMVGCSEELFHQELFMHTAEHIDDLARIGCSTSSPCGRYIASIDGSGNLRLWDVETGACLHRVGLGMCCFEVLSAKVVFSSDSTQLCVFSPFTQKIYDVGYFSQKLIKFSDEERKNGIKTYIRKQGAAEGASILDVLQRREIELKKKRQ